VSTHVWPDNREGHIIRLVAGRLGRVFEDAYPSPWEDTLVLKAKRLIDVLSFLQKDPDTDLNQLVDLTCVDRGEAATPRFEVVYRVRSARLAYRLTVLVPVEDSESTVPSVVELFPAASWYERELWEMYGVYPDGHPDLRHLLLYDGFAGHALRRDYPADKGQPLVPRQTSDVEVKIIGDPSGPASKPSASSGSAEESDDA
jgi:NADH-quinone oxidoreductase subunit C